MTYDRQQDSDDLGDTDTTNVGDMDTDLDTDISTDRRVSSGFGNHTPIDPDSDVDIDTDTDQGSIGGGQV